MTPADHLRPGPELDDVLARRVEGTRPEPGDWPPGWHVYLVPETGSTNADLLAIAEAGAPDRTVLRTDHQTAGRGRLDRRWDAPPGTNLLVSLLLRRQVDEPGEVVRRVGLAAVTALRELGAPREVGLKWPNDLVVGDVKLAGILAQRAPDGSVVVGLGLNVGWAPDGASCVHDVIPGGARPTPAAVLGAVLAAFDALPADTVALHDHYRGTLTTLGRQVRVELPAGELVGRAVDVDPDGRLVVLDECAMSHHVDVGDVIHLRPA